MKTQPLIAIGLTGLLAGMLSAAHADVTVVIIRHAEKPAAGLGQLSCQGLNRALALPAVLLKRYGQPSALYAPNPSLEKEDKGKPYSYVRPLATIEPLAVQAGLPVRLQWGFKQTEPLLQALTKQPDGTYIVAWEHHWGEKLARALMAAGKGDASQVPTWADTDFDSIYVVRLAGHAPAFQGARFELAHQGLNGLPDTCPQPRFDLTP